jgi:hypothetical protein
MKNIHLIPTDKPSRLVRVYNDFERNNFTLKLDAEVNDSFKEYVNIFITSDEDIKEEKLRWIIDYRPNMNGFIHQVSVVLDLNLCPEIILTDNKDLIKDGVQAIDNEFLKFIVKNPSCDRVEVINDDYIDIEKDEYVDLYKIIIPQEKPKQELERGITITHIGKQETLEEAAKESDTKIEVYDSFEEGFIEGAKWQAERIFNLTENQIAELANIGSKHLYLGAMDEGRLSYGGVLEILKRYEELCKIEFNNSNKKLKS